MFGGVQFEPRSGAVNRLRDQNRRIGRHRLRRDLAKPHEPVPI